MSLFLQLKEKYEKQYHMIDDIRRIVHEDLSKEDAELFEMVITHVKLFLLEIQKKCGKGDIAGIEKIVETNLELFN